MATKIVLLFMGIGIGFFCHDAYNNPSDDNTFTRMAATVIAGFYIGVLGVFYFLPAVSHKFAQFMFSDSNEKSDADVLHKARSLVAQGEYEGAVIAYRRVLLKNANNRLAWTDMAKLYGEKLNQPQLAAATLYEACYEHTWTEEDVAFLLFRLAEWQLEGCDDREAGAKTLREIIKHFPDTRDSANAKQQLQELGFR